jgi:hypothetical protein
MQGEHAAYCLRLFRRSTMRNLGREPEPCERAGTDMMLTSSFTETFIT